MHGYTNSENYKAIADAIREKTGDTEPISPLEMPEKILSIGNAFKDARNFEEANLENIELKDGDLFYVEQKEEFKETPNGGSATLTEISPEIEEQPYRNIIQLNNSNYEGLNLDEVFPYTDMNFDITEDFLRDRMRLWKWDESYIDEEGNYKPQLAVGIFLLPNNIELPFSEDEFSSDEYVLYTKEHINEYSKVIPTFTLGQVFGEVFQSSVFSTLVHDNLIYVIKDTDNESFVNFSTPVIGKYTIVEYEENINVNYVPILKSSYDEFNTFNCNGNTFIISDATEYRDYYYIAISEETNRIEDLYSGVLGRTITFGYDFFNSNRGFLETSDYFYRYNSNSPLLSYPLLKEVEHLLSIIKRYDYYAPIKQYIMYSQGRFYTIGDKEQKPLVNRKTLLKVLEAIEQSENEDFSIILTTVELFQIFNIKIISEQYILEPVQGVYGFVYMGISPAFNMKFIDREHVKVYIYGGSGSGSGSNGGGDSSSQELYIGEFEE